MAQGRNRDKKVGGIGEPIEIIRHGTLDECQRAFYGIGENDPFPKGTWEWMTADGVPKRCTTQKALARIAKKKCWGWCEDKKRLHLWISPDADLSDVVQLIAHERGHMQRPHHRSINEERKANVYGEVALFAYDVATAMLGVK